MTLATRHAINNDMTRYGREAQPHELQNLSELVPGAPTRWGVVVKEKDPTKVITADMVVEIVKKVGTAVMETATAASSKTHSQQHQAEIKQSLLDNLNSHVADQRLVASGPDATAQAPLTEEEAKERDAANSEAAPAKQKKKLKRNDSTGSAASEASFDYAGGLLTRRKRRLSRPTASPAAKKDHVLGPAGHPQDKVSKERVVAQPSAAGGKLKKDSALMSPWELDQARRRKLQAMDRHQLAFDHTLRDFECEPVRCDVAALRATGKNIGALIDAEFFALFRDAPLGCHGNEKKDQLDQCKTKLYAMGDAIESFKVTLEQVRKKAELQAAYVAVVFWERLLGCLKLGLPVHHQIALKCGERILDDMISCHQFEDIVNMGDPTTADKDDKTNQLKSWHITILPADIVGKGDSGSKHREEFQSKCVVETVSKMLWIDTDAISGTDGVGGPDELANVLCAPSDPGSVTAIVPVSNALCNPPGKDPKDHPVYEAMTCFRQAMVEGRFILCRDEHQQPLDDCIRAMTWTELEWAKVKKLREDLKSSVQLRVRLGLAGSCWTFLRYFESRVRRWAPLWLGLVRLSFVAKLHRQFRSITVGRKVIQGGSKNGVIYFYSRLFGPRLVSSSC